MQRTAGLLVRREQHFDFTAQRRVVQAVFGHWFGQLVLFGFSWALIHHALGGIRHLIWDTGYGLDLASANRLAWANIAGSIALTILLWIAILWAR